MYKIELALDVSTQEEALSILDRLELGTFTLRKMGQLFVADFESETELSDRAYEAIFREEKASIILDSASQQRGEEVAHNLYLVEAHLRKLLLYIPKAAGSYLGIVAQKASHYNGDGKLTSKNSHDVLTSELTLGQVIEVFEFNTAVNIDEAISWSRLLEMLEGVRTIPALVKRIQQKTTPVTIWNIISDHVLDKPVAFEEIEGKLRKLKSIRDTAAHYRTVTPKHLSEALYLSKGLISMLQPKHVTDKDNIAIQAADENASRIIKATAVNGGYPLNWDQAPIDTIIDRWGFYNRESVSYAAWKVYESGRHMPFWAGRGNANQWPANARADGIPVSNKPIAGCVAISTQGMYGHAMWVEDVHEDGSIRVSQYNHDLTGVYSEAVFTPQPEPSIHLLPMIGRIYNLTRLYGKILHSNVLMLLLK